MNSRQTKLKQQQKLTCYLQEIISSLRTHIDGKTEGKIYSIQTDVFKQAVVIIPLSTEMNFSKISKNRNIKSISNENEVGSDKSNFQYKGTEYQKAQLY